MLPHQHINDLNRVIAPYFVRWFRDFDIDTTCGVAFHHANEHVIMYEARIVFMHKLDCDQVRIIADAMTTFCTWEGDTFDIEGRTWHIGDGDDTGAAHIDGGVLRVWVRLFL